MFPSPSNEDSPRDPAAVRKRLQTVLERAGCKKVRSQSFLLIWVTQPVPALRRCPLCAWKVLGAGFRGVIACGPPGNPVGQLFLSVAGYVVKPEVQKFKREKKCQEQKETRIIGNPYWLCVKDLDFLCGSVGDSSL